MSKNKEKTYQSVCRICHGGCAATLTIKDNKLTKVRPATGSPFNLGQFCSKGLATPNMMYHPDRILAPLKRVGKRGANQWQEVSWDVALDEIVEKLNTIRHTLGAESIALGQGTGRHHYMHLIRFANTLGTPNWYEPGFANCFIPRITVSNHTYGGFVSADLYGEISPKTILFWGRNPLVSGPDGELSFAVRKVLDEGSFGITIDPRRSETAKECKLWLPLRPGTDDALALAMIHVIIYENIYDKEFVEKWTTGFSELKTHVKTFTPQWAAEITGLPVNDIVTTARRYALDKPSVIEWGVAIEQNTNSLQTVRAIAILRGITGNIDIPGGDILGMNIIHSYPLMRDKLPWDVAQKRLGGEQFKFLSGSMAMLPSAHVPSVFDAMLTGKPYPIKALLNFGSNPLTTVANSKKVYEALLKLDLLVVVDMFKTPTAALADYILPASFWPEINQIIELPFIAQNSVTAQPKILQTGLCRADEDIMIDLAQRLNLPGADETVEDIINYRLEPLGIDFNELKEKVTVFPPHEYRKFEKNGFQTLSGKVELYSEMLEMSGYDPLPTYKEPPESPISQPETNKKFPYVLITGARNRGFFHSEHRQIDILRKKRPDPLAQIHPNTAAVHEIKQDEWIYVSSPRDKIKMKAWLSTDIKEGVVSIDHGWWFPEKASTGFGLWESNANLLTSDQPPYDPGFGTYQLRGLLCQIEKISVNKSVQKENEPETVITEKISLNIANNLEQASRLFPEKTALIFEEQAFTFEELNNISNQIATGLSQLGIKRGERVVLFLPNSPEFISSYFAIQKLGAVAVIVNPALTAREVSYIVNDSGAIALITTESLRSAINNEDVLQLVHILITEGAVKDDISLAHLINQRAVNFKTEVMKADDPSAILYTSGTTGFPKGAVISHGNIIFDARTTAYLYRMQPDDRVLLFSPLSHSFTLSAGLNTSIATASTIILHRDFEPNAVINSITEHKISCFYGSTPVYSVLVEKASLEQMQSVRFYISGGTAMPSELAQKWQQKFKQTINISYGLTECSQCCFNHYLKPKAGAVGAAVEGVEIKVVDEDGESVAVGQSGELVVKSPKIILGYWNRAKETADAIKDGWFYTGDIGYKDIDGYIFINDRKKDMLNVGGQSMYPSEVEAILAEHPAIAEVAVYGIPVAVMGEQVCAAVVLQSGQKADETEIIDYCQGLMAGYKIPSTVNFIAALPKAKSGKILKRVLREQVDLGLQAPPSGTTNSESLSVELIQQWIMEWLSKQFKLAIEEIQIDKAFTEYGLTSILTMKLMRDLGSRSERAVDPVVAWHYPTTELLANYLVKIWNLSSDAEIPKIQKVARDQAMPLSFLQEEVWFNCQSQDNNKLWSRLNFWKLTGTIDIQCLQKSINELIQRHENLRVNFPLKDGFPLQQIVSKLRFYLQVIDLSFISEPEQTEEVDDLILQETQQPLDLINSPPWRVKLIRLNDKSHILWVYIHHIIMDASSMEIFFRDLFKLYEINLLKQDSSSLLPLLPIQYADFAHWQRACYSKKKLTECLKYYQELFPVDLPRLNLITDKPRITNGSTFPAAIEGFQLSAKLTDDLKALSQQRGITLFISLFSLLAALLYRYTGNKEIVIAVPMSKRFHQETESIFGDFSGQIVIRISFSDSLTFSNLLNQTQLALQSALTHQELTYKQVIKALDEKEPKDLNYQMPYQVMLNLLPTPVTEIRSAGIIASPIEENIREKMFLDLAMPIWEEKHDEGNVLKAKFRYRSDLFETSTILKMIANFNVLLNTMITNPEQLIKPVDLNI